MWKKNSYFAVRKNKHQKQIVMKNILVIGSTGQIGSELTMELRRRYGNDHVIAGYITGAEPKGELLESGPSALADVTNGEMIAEVVKKYNVDAIYNLAALLSVVAESKPRLAWKIGIDGLWNILEVARENNCKVFTPSFLSARSDTALRTTRHHRTLCSVRRQSTVCRRLRQSCFLTTIRRSMAQTLARCASRASYHT